MCDVIFCMQCTINVILIISSFRVKFSTFPIPGNFFRFLAKKYLVVRVVIPLSTRAVRSGHEEQKEMEREGKERKRLPDILPKNKPKPWTNGNVKIARQS